MDYEGNPPTQDLNQLGEGNDPKSVPGSNDKTEPKMNPFEFPPDGKKEEVD